MSPPAPQRDHAVQLGLMAGHDKPARVIKQLTLNLLSRRCGDGPPLRVAVWRTANREATGGITETSPGGVDFSKFGRDRLHDAVEAMGARWAEVLRKRWPVNTSKLAARAFDVSPRTVEGWLGGQPCYAKHLMTACTKLGEAAVAYVLAPGGPWQRQSSVAAALLNIEGELAGLAAAAGDVVLLRAGA